MKITQYVSVPASVFERHGHTHIEKRSDRKVATAVGLDGRRERSCYDAARIKRELAGGLLRLA